MQRLSDLMTRRRPDVDSPELEDRLQGWIETAEAAWPALGLDASTFVSYVTDRLPPAGEAAAFLSTLHLADLYLACACARQLAPAIQAFDRVYLAQVAPVVARMDPSRDFADEVRQRLRERMLVGSHPRITDYGGVGSLGGWVRVSTSRLALNLIRERKREVAMRVRGAVQWAEDGLGKGALDAGEAQLRLQVENVFRVALRQLPPAERRLLRQYYLERLSQEEMARQGQVSRRTIIRQLQVARERALRLTKQELERRMPGITTNTRESLFRVLHDLDANLRSALRSG